MHFSASGPFFHLQNTTLRPLPPRSHLFFLTGPPASLFQGPGDHTGPRIIQDNLPISRSLLLLAKSLLPHEVEYARIPRIRTQRDILGAIIQPTTSIKCNMERHLKTDTEIRQMLIFCLIFFRFFLFVCLLFFEIKLYKNSQSPVWLSLPSLLRGNHFPEVGENQPRVCFCYLLHIINEFCCCC